MNQITYRPVFDSKGDFVELELWQGDQHLTVLLSLPSSHHDGHRWNEVVEAVKGIATMVQDKQQGKIYKDAHD